MAGKTIGHYVLEAEAGTGGLGQVYRAYDARLHRPVAIKMLHADLRQGSGWDDILAEARAASALNHPGICTVYEAGEAAGEAYIAMEFVDGKPLGQVIPSSGLPVETALRYGYQIADALAHGHAKGVCHGDLTSSNVMVDGDDRIKILDFGLAQRFAVPPLPAAGDHSISRGRPAILRDIQRFGAVLYEMATGMLPGSRESMDANLNRLTPALRVPIYRSLNAGDTGGYEAIGEARDDLQACLSPAPAASVAARSARWPHRAGWAAGAAAAIILGVVWLGVWHTRQLQSHAAPRAQRAVAVARQSVRQASRVKLDGPGEPTVRVWANTKTGIYHCPQTRWYGKTKTGEFMAQAEAERRGFTAEAGKVCEK